MNQNYPANSHSSKERVKLQPVTVNKVTTRKRGLGRKMADTFTGDDAKSVGEYIFVDVFVPAIKSLVADAVTQGVERMIFGDVRRRNPQARQGYTNYSGFSPTKSRSPGLRALSPDGPTTRDISRRSRGTHDFDEIVIETRTEAELVIERLQDVLNEYNVVTVADLYELVGITGSFTDNKWGWYNLSRADVSLVRGGYLLDLPRPEPID